MFFPQISGEKSRYRVAESEISEVGMVDFYPRGFNDDMSSQTSESLRYIEFCYDVIPSFPGSERCEYLYDDFVLLHSLLDNF